jgi:hypothetical protein
MSLGADDKPSASTGTQQTQTERALAERAAADWNRYIDRFAPVEDIIPSLTSNLRERRQRAMMDASATAMDQSGFGADTITRSGMPANSAPIIGDNAARATVFRRGLAAVPGALEPNLQSLKTGGQLKVAANLRGLQDNANLVTGSLARDATQTAIETAQARDAARYAALEAGFGAAGMATASWMTPRGTPAPIENRSVSIPAYDAGLRAAQGNSVPGARGSTYAVGARGWR